MFSETDDTLFPAASEETPANVEQTVGEDGSESVSQLKTRLAEMETKLAERDKKIENANKLIGRKAVDMDTLRSLGLVKEEQAHEAATQAAQTMTRTEGRQMAQQIGGDELEAWFKKASEDFGPAKAIQALFNAYLPQALGQHLAPVNEQLSTAHRKVNAAAIKGAASRLYDEFEDVSAKEAAIKQYLKENPKKMALLESTDTDEEEKYDILETAYLKVSKKLSANSIAASKAAGAVEAKQREQAKASSVTSGSGARSSKNQGEKTPGDKWLEEMLEHDKGSRLFD